MRHMERSSEGGAQARPERAQNAPWGVRDREPGAEPGPTEGIEPGASGGPGVSGAGKEALSGAEYQPRSVRGRFQKADRAGRYNENLARQADAGRRADDFKAQVLAELGGAVDASKEPLLDALCATKVRAENFKRKGRVNKFLEESERYVRLAYMLGLIKAGQHAERPAPKEMPARDHAEWVAMRRRRKR
jgi:hypothetical protein